MHGSLVHVQLHHHGHSLGNGETGIVGAIAFQRIPQRCTCDRFIGNIEVAVVCGVRGNAGATRATTHVSHTTHAHVHVHVRHTLHAHTHAAIGSSCFSWLRDVSRRSADRLSDSDLHDFVHLRLIGLLSSLIYIRNDFQQLPQNPEVFLRVVDLQCLRQLSSPWEQVTQYCCLAGGRPFHKWLGGCTSHIDLSPAVGARAGWSLSSSHFHVHAHAHAQTTFLLEIGGPLSASNSCELGESVANVIRVLPTQGSGELVFLFCGELHIVLKGQLDGPRVFVDELVQESIIEGVFWPNENILLAVIELSPRLQHFILPLADQLLHLLMRQVIGDRVDLILHTTDALDLAFDFRGLRCILFLEC